ncbi:beta-ketoacyl-ACP reductase [Acrocarpospora phusangensis]|uniref:Beta-ketoacyl-ACP reductase n=1 Tax=Acrocarpospora phusangensis TaxID=1070424 RepID=A0A919Q7Q0_9ACTN|nr:SDR family oxidoreductase [Acrocarpospora phusangensis]GIH23984.1 beta-ketoacyl-ACP reductase [Acrocarpospora phusangensis]
MPEDPLSDPFADAGPRWMAGRAALVTGAGQNGALPGVGYAVSRVLAAHGARVAVLDRDADAAERTVASIVAAGGEASAVVADVTSDRQCADAVAAAVDRLGGLDALVNNVASGDPAGLFDVTPERFAELMNVNLTSAWQVTRHAVPVLPRGGAIVNISSVTVGTRGPGMVYSVAKAGLENLTDGAAATLGPRGIRVNCVRVGMIWGAFAAANMPEERREPRRLSTGLRTEGTAWDVAHACLFLLSDRARWISGHTLTVDGGPPGTPPPVASPPGDRDTSHRDT